MLDSVQTGCEVEVPEYGFVYNFCLSTSRLFAAAVNSGFPLFMFPLVGNGTLDIQVTFVSFTYAILQTIFKAWLPSRACKEGMGSIPTY